MFDIDYSNYNNIANTDAMLNRLDIVDSSNIYDIEFTPQDIMVVDYLILIQ